MIDLPGTYSLAARSPDEMVVVDVLLGQPEQCAQNTQERRLVLNLFGHDAYLNELAICG